MTEIKSETNDVKSDDNSKSIWNFGWFSNNNNKTNKSRNSRANNDDCKLCELNLIKEFIDDNNIEYKQHDIPINYNCIPQSVLEEQKLKQEQAKKSIFNNIFKYQNINENDNNNDNNKFIEYIHTISFKLKETFNEISRKNSFDNLLKITKDYEMKSNNNDNNNENKTNEFHTDRKKREYSRKKNTSSHSLYDLTDIIKDDISLNSNNDSKNNDNIPIVLTHGYASAGGMYIHTIQSLYKTLNDKRDIHVIDWLGNGCSSRPEFLCKNADESETFFIDSLNEWRKKMNINKMILLGHSLGGYLSCCYAMKYPQYVDHLILVSPVGIPKRPDNSERPNTSWKIKLLFNTFEHLWNRGWTPHDAIKLIPNSKKVIHNIIDKRLFRLPSSNEEKNGDILDKNAPINNDNIDEAILKKNKKFKVLLGEYLYHVICQKGSSEYALNRILLPGAWAVKPLCNRLHELKKYQDINGLKIDFIYGETDWMSSEHAMKLKDDNKIDCNVYVVPNAGHQLIIENGKHWSKLVAGIIKKGTINDNNNDINNHDINDEIKSNVE